MNEKIIKKVLSNKINKKHSLGRPKTRWIDAEAIDIKNIAD